MDRKKYHFCPVETYLRNVFVRYFKSCCKSPLSCTRLKISKLEFKIRESLECVSFDYRQIFKFFSPSNRVVKVVSVPNFFKILFQFFSKLVPKFFLNFIFSRRCRIEVRFHPKVSDTWVKAKERR